MARLTEIVVAIEAEGVNDVLNALKQVDGAQAKVADGAKKSGDAQKSGNDTAKMSWATLATGVNQAMGVINTAIQGGKAVYDFTKEGAQLEYAAGKFERLAEAAGTTSDVLMTDLRAATRGMVSDADLVAGAGDFMALGLAKSHDEVVRLTNVAGALGMNMNQLVLTLTNQTTMRFDALGVSVDGFDEKVKALEAAGYSAEEAFSEAFLQQAEEQIQKVGEVADTTAGSFKHLESAWSNWISSVKMGAGEKAVPIVDTLAAGLEGMSLEETTQGMIKSLRELGMTWREIKNVTGMKTFYILDDVDYLADQKVAIESMTKFNEQYKYLTEELGYTSEEAVTQLDKTWSTFSVDQMTDTTDVWAAGIEGVGQAAGITARTFTDIYNESLVGVAAMSLGYQTMTTDWKTMRSMAEGYDGALTLINKNTERQKQLEPFKETGGYIDGVWKSAKQVKDELAALEGSSADAAAAMERMAAEMTLSLMQASMGIDGYTESEIDTLTQYMVDAGLISQAAADKMKADYMAAITYANALELDQKIGEILADVTGYDNGLEIVNGKLVDPKTGEVLADLTDYLDGLTEADLAKLDPKVAEVVADIMPYIRDLLDLPDPESKVVEITAKYIENNFTPTKLPKVITIPVVYSETTHGYGQALGGAVYPGQNYLWQEPGREGELLLPEQYGRVLSNHEVAMVLREAIGGGGNTSNQHQTVNNYYNNYSLTMPTSNSTSDVKRAFAIMEALNK